MPHIRLALILAAGACAAASAAGPASTGEDPRFQPEALRGDLAIIERGALDGNPVPDRYEPRAALEAMFAEVRAKLDRPMTELEFYRIVAPAVARLRNGHTLFNLSAPRMTWLTEAAPLLPLGIRIVDGRPWVFRDLSGGDTPLAGAELLSIGGVPARALVDASVNALSFDGETRGPRESSIGGWQILYDLVLLHGLGPRYETVVRRDGETMALTLTGRSGVDLAREWRSRYPADAEVARSAAPSLTIHDGLARIRIPHWDYPEEGKPGLIEAIDGWFTQIAKAQPDALVIDLRNNGGGNEPPSTHLLTYLADRPFKYYTCINMRAADFPFLDYAPNGDELRKVIPDYVRPASPECRSVAPLEVTEGAYPNQGVRQPSAPHFGGRVYVLINGGSFSTTAEFATIFKELKRGTVIGQESSGGYRFNTSGINPRLVLPGTKMRFQAPLISFDLAVTPHPGPQGGVLPDVTTRYDLQDWIKGRDLEMEQVLALERRAAAPGRRGPSR